MRILLVDASDAFRARLQQRLSVVPGAAVVGEAAHEDQAVLTAGLCKPDVILTDLTLGSGTGFSAIKRLRAGGFQGTAYAVTTQDESDAGPLCLAAGIDGYYDKVHDLDRLVDALVGIANAPVARAHASLKVAGA